MIPFDAARLYEDAAFARRLARNLVGEASADDVVQDAWRVMLQKPPQRSPRAYLATLVRRMSLRSIRAQARRREREEVAARAEVLPSSAALVARMEVHRRAVDAVLELEEPYRSTIVLRFFEDLPAARIADRQGIPVETVRTRMKRGLGQLRARLERGDDEEGTDWLATLTAAWSPERRKAAPTTLPGPVRAVGTWTSTHSALLFTGFLVALTALVLIRMSPEDDAPRAILATDTTGAAPASDAPESVARAGRLPLATDPAEGSPGPADRMLAAEATVILQGRVSDAAGSAVPDAEVIVFLGLEDGEIGRTRSDVDGDYAVRLTRLEGLSADQWQALELGTRTTAVGFQPAMDWISLTGRDAPIRVDVSLEPGGSLAGRVVDEGGFPVEMARFLARFVAREGGESAYRSEMTDRRGEFCVAFPATERLVSVEAWKDELGLGFRDLAGADLARGEDGRSRLDDPLVLQRYGSLVGRAVYPDGAPVRNVNVRARLAEADGTGTFRPAPKEPIGRHGMMQNSVYTRDDGAFAIHGLRAGLYRVGDSSVFSAGALAEGWSAADVHRTDSGDVELVVDRHRLLVQVEGRDGDALSGARVACTRLEPAADGGWTAGSSTRSQTHGRDRSAAFTVRPQTSVAIYAAVPGCAPVEVRIDVPELPYELPVRLALRDAGDAAVARVILAGTDAPPDAFRLHLFAPYSGLELGDFRDFPVAADGRAIGLPAGEFQVELEPRAGSSADGCHPPARTREIVILRPDVTVAVPVRFEAGGSVKIDFALADSETDGADFHRWGDEGELETDDWLSLAFFGAHPPGLAFHAVDAASGATAPEPAFQWAGARPAAFAGRSFPLPIGDYVLRASLPGFHPAEATVSIRACALTETAVRLEQE